MMSSDRANDGANPPRPDLLLGASGQLWGDLSWPNEEPELPKWPTETGADWDLSSLFESASDDDLTAPSAGEIDLLLNQLNKKNVLTSPTPTPHAVAVRRANIDSLGRSIQSLTPDLRNAFLEDLSRCVHSLQRSLLDLKSAPQPNDLLNQINRELHTLKGASASIGLMALADHLHQLEDSLLHASASGRLAQIQALLSSLDEIRSSISCGQRFDATSLPLNDHSKTPSDLETRTESLSKEGPESAQQAASSDGDDEYELVRLKASQLDRLAGMLAELMVIHGHCKIELGERQRRGHGNRPGEDRQMAVSKLIRQLRQELVELRQTSILTLFQRMQQVVDMTAQAEHKDVCLNFVGVDVKIDRALQQQLYGPLLHIVRNAICHGIESPQQRLRAGKPAVGTVTLRARSSQDLLEIEINDDGCGLDYDAIRRRGIASGLLTADQDANRDELVQLIFRPGFSTRQTIDHVAGRGVGMDVVATVVERMGGWLQVDSPPHQGMRIRLCFPMPSLTVQVLVFRCAGHAFAVPMQSVIRVEDSTDTSAGLDFAAVLGTRHHDAVQLRRPIVLDCQRPRRPSSADCLHCVTLLVDEVIGSEEAVVQPLPKLLANHAFCSGAMLSQTGQTVLILAPDRLIQSHTGPVPRTHTSR